MGGMAKPQPPPAELVERLRTVVARHAPALDEVQLDAVSAEAAAAARAFVSEQAKHRRYRRQRALSSSS